MTKIVTFFDKRHYNFIRSKRKQIQNDLLLLANGEDSWFRGKKKSFIVMI